MRQIVLDTETTGLEPKLGHRVIEIGCVELLNRRLTGSTFHVYLNPDRDIDEGAIQVHGITNEFLADKPRFADIARDFIEYIDGADLVIHNAPFDTGFLDHELARLGAEFGSLADRCTVTDTLGLARRKHPGQKNNLDALCKRYEIDNTQRELHGALLDAQILADVYLAMTGGQTRLLLDGEEQHADFLDGSFRPVPSERPPLKVIQAAADELAAHERQVQLLQETSGGRAIWLQAATEVPS